jgi:Arc/MetJ family transcription regulator
MIVQSGKMKLTLSIDDELLQNAAELTGFSDVSAVVDAALKVLVEREAARRLARMGGSCPDIEAPPRRRQKPGAPSSRQFHRR